MEVTVRNTNYRLFVLAAEDQFVARAFRADTGDRFGVDVAAHTEAAALQRLTAWLEWHHDHLNALDALRAAERAYHRAVATSAFVVQPDAHVQSEGEERSIEALDRARVALDEVRARQPRT